MIARWRQRRAIRRANRRTTRTQRVVARALLVSTAVFGVHDPGLRDDVVVPPLGGVLGYAFDYRPPPPIPDDFARPAIAIDAHPGVTEAQVEALQWALTQMPARFLRRVHANGTRIALCKDTLAGCGLPIPDVDLNFESGPKSAQTATGLYLPLNNTVYIAIRPYYADPAHSRELRYFLGEVASHELSHGIDLGGGYPGWSATPAFMAARAADAGKLNPYQVHPWVFGNNLGGPLETFADGLGDAVWPFRPITKMTRPVPAHTKAYFDQNRNRIITEGAPPEFSHGPRLKFLR